MPAFFFLYPPTKGRTMTTDEALIAEIALQEEATKKLRRQPRREIDPVPTVEVPKRAHPPYQGKLWVKCVSDAEPWANGAKMLYWQDYHVEAEDAFLLEDRQFAVILKEPTDQPTGDE
jgi:hypothetical protein